VLKIKCPHRYVDGERSAARLAADPPQSK